MASVDPNSSAHSFRGRVGTTVFRHFNSRTFVSCRPNPTSKPPTPAQVAHRERFRDAMRKAREALGAPEKRARYEGMAKVEHRPALILAFRDIMCAPEIATIALDEALGADGTDIVVAVEDITVERVDVSVRAADGAVLETGPAVPDGNVWRYRLAQPLPRGQSRTVAVTARDLPGNQTTRAEIVTRR